MYRRRRFYPTRRKGRYRMIRTTANNASPNATLNNIDLLAVWRTAAGISINLPEFTIWRVRIKISIIIGGEAAVSSNDGVLATVFVDGQNQGLLNQLSFPLDERDMLYDFMYVSDTLKQSSDNLSPTNVVLYKEFDIKTHRKLESMQDTLWLQLAASGNTTITNYSYSAVITAKVG